MSVAVPTPSDGHVASPVEEARQRMSIVPITIEQYQKMIDQGIVPEDSTVELLRGVLVRKDRSVIGEDSMGHSPLHKAILALLTELSAKINDAHGHLQIQLPVLCPPDGAPEPDGSIIRGRPRDYLDRLPLASEDVTCIIEVAHSSLFRDREDKLPMYAAAGVAQYIIINLQNLSLEVHIDPDRQAQQYRAKSTLVGGAKLVLQLPNRTLEIQASEILP